MYEFLSWRVDDVMTSDVVAIGPDTTVGEAEDLFAARDFDALPVLDASGALAGIVSKLDMLRAYHFTPESIVPPYAEIRRRPVRTVMTLQPLGVERGQPLTRVLETLLATRVKSLPVLEEGRLVGIVAREDVLRALRAAAGGERPPR
jgi:CBS domain-containing protein